MKEYRILFPAKGRAELCEYGLTGPGEDEVLIRNEYSVLSAGTERANLLDLPNTSGAFPKTAGYCAVGVIEKTGGAVENVRAGERVLVYHGGHCTRSVVKAAGLVAVPPSVDPLEAAFVVIASMSLQGVRKTRLELGESALVIGQGLLGVFATQLCRIAGAMPVVAIDYDSTRRELALALGAHAAFSPDEPRLKEKCAEATRRRGMNAVIEVTGAVAALRQALELVSWEGRIALLGCTRVSDQSIDFYQLVHKPGVSIIGAHNFVRPKVDSYPGYWTRQDDYRALLDLIGDGRLKVRPVISQVVSPEQAPQVYARLAEGTLPLGVVFDWNGL